MPKIIPIQNIEDIRNKVTSLSEDVTDEQYPSAKAVYDAISSININDDAAIISYNGNFTDFITWRIESDTNNNTTTLYINGQGRMPDTAQIYSTIKDSENNVPTITKIIIGDGITYIGKRNFKDLTTVTDIVFGDSITNMSYECFKGCTSLTFVKLNQNLTELGSKTFEGCTSLESIVIPSSIKSINNRAFNGCTALENILLPDSLEFIGKDVFYNTAYYNDDSNWENGALYIGNHLIKYKGSDTTHTVKEGTKVIAGEAFRPVDEDAENTTLEYVTIPNSVVGIGEGTFRNCNSLMNITLPFVGVSRSETNTEKSVFGYIFGYEDNETEGTIVQWYSSENCCYYYIPTSLESVTITDATQIPYGAFYNWASLTNIVIPNSIRSIGSEAFLNCPSMNIKYIGLSSQWDLINIEDNDFSNHTIEFVIESTSNKITAIDESSTDTQYPSAKAVYDKICEMGHSLIIIENDWIIKRFSSGFIEGTKKVFMPLTNSGPDLYETGGSIMDFPIMLDIDKYNRVDYYTNNSVDIYISEPFIIEDSSLNSSIAANTVITYNLSSTICDSTIMYINVYGYEKV